MSAAWSPLVRTRFATDNVEVAHDLIARMYANNTLQASGGNGSFRLEMSGVGTTDLRVDRLRYGVACSGVLGPVGYLLFHTTTAGRYQMTTTDTDVRYSRGCLVLSRWESRSGSAGALIMRSGCCRCAGTWWLSMRPR